jgi:hypothetical protein
VAALVEGPLAGLLHADRASLFILDADRRSLHRVSAPRPPMSMSEEDPDAARSLAAALASIPLGEGLVGYVAKTGKTLRLPAGPGTAAQLADGWVTPAHLQVCHHVCDINACLCIALPGAGFRVWTSAAATASA